MRVLMGGAVLVGLAGLGARAASPTLPDLGSIPGFNLKAHERARLVAKAEAALADAPRTIVAVRNPRSAGGLHDFSSDGDYWWPDPKNPEGPYVERDGVTNPGNFVAHRELLLRFGRTFGYLAGAYKVTGDERFAAAAVRHLDAWFVAPATRMNPDLSYAQAIQGRNTGRSIGVIDTVHLAEVALGVEALRGSQALSAEEETAIEGWFRAYLRWLTTHPFGVRESREKNNHGTCAWLQIAAFAHLLGDTAKLAAARDVFQTVLVPNQMAANGSFPLELRRTKPYGYSIFNLDVMTALAVVCSTRDSNLVAWTMPDGRGIRRALEWLAPYIASKEKWLAEVHRTRLTKDGQVEMTTEHVLPDVMYWPDWPVRQPALIFGALAFQRRDWLAEWSGLDPDPGVPEIIRNFPIREPVLWVR